MADGNPLINLGDLSQPVVVLIEKISNAIGLVYEPLHIKRKAKAEAEAEKIRVIANIEMDEIQQRTLARLLHQESRKQENIEHITAEAASQLPSDAQVEQLEEDWLAHFFKSCDSVSDKEMQSLWSRLLSGEATKPGTFSKRTVDFVASMDKKDALLFTTFCQFIWFQGGFVPLIYKSDDDVYTKNGINFNTLKHLDAIGLISFEPTSGYVRKKYFKHSYFSYGGNHTLIEFQKDIDNTLKIGQALLTQIGQELVPICGVKQNEEFYHYIIQQWSKQGLVCSSVITNP